METAIVVLSVAVASLAVSLVVVVFKLVAIAGADSEVADLSGRLGKQAKDLKAAVDKNR